VTLPRRLATASAFETLPVAALLLELDGTILAANLVATRAAEQTLEGMAIHVLIPELAARWHVLIKTAYGYGQAIDEVRLVTPSGVRRVLQVVIAIADVDSRPIVQAIAIDITERKRVESATHERHLESLAVVAGGIAHDFNNLLVGVLAEATAAREDEAIGPMTADSLRRIEGAARRMAQLTRQLLAFAGRAQVLTTRLRADSIVDDSREALASLIRTGAQLAIDLEAGAAVVEADAGLLRQVLHNLIANAADADARHIRVRTHVVRERWTLEVSDDGAGIDPTTLARIFEPFFTTKGDRHGLGLSAVHGIVRRLGGDVDVESEVGNGSRFRFWLPVIAGATPSKPRAKSEPGATAKLKLAGLRVLVADDEPSVRATVRRLLERRGAAVVVAVDGLDAEARLRDETFDLVMLDVQMPGRNGHDVLVTARALHPNLPVILMSGYVEKTRGEGSEEEADAFLEKPFSASAVDTLVADVLDRAKRRR
jgi:two-component system, cell cycle sensor histidine kinase and response regulator CckA